MKRLADWASRPRDFREWVELAVTAVVLSACTLFVFVALHPSKLFLNTLTAGGDMGAHVWAPWFLKNHLLPHGRVSGWAPAWYDGFPALTFYFPLPYLAIALLSYVIPYDVAFKLVSVSGCVCLPLCAYAFGRLTRMRFPGPPILAIAVVPYLFDRYWTIYGGNIASTLAGEFAFEISLCLALLFLGVFARALETGRHRWLAALLLAGCIGSHILPGFFAVGGGLLIWALQPSRRRLGRALVIGVVGLCVIGFWLIPFALRHGYSNNMGWVRWTSYAHGLLPWTCPTHGSVSDVNCSATNVVHPYTVHLKIVVALAAAGVLGGLFLRRRATLIIAGLGVGSAAAFRFMPQGALWNARVLPFWYLSLYLAAGACVAESALAVGVLLGRTPRPRATVGLTPSAVDDEPGESAPEEPARELVGVGATTGGGSAGDWSASDGDPSAGWVPSGDGDGPIEPDGDGIGNGPPPADGPWSGWSPDLFGGDLVPNPWPALLMPVLVGLLVLAFVGQGVAPFTRVAQKVPAWLIDGHTQRANPNFVGSWADWNYSGYQEKSAFPEYQDVMATMARVGQQDGCGRALWEYEPEENRFGTPMALMLLPYWTHGCIDSEEGLFFESSATVPYHFLNQSELSENPSRAMSNLPYRSFNILDGVQHLQLLGVRYYMAISPGAQAAAKTLTLGSEPLLRLVATSQSHQIQYTTNGTSTNEARSWQVYEVADSDVVAPLSYAPAVVTGVKPTGRSWINMVVPWYQDASRWEVPLAASGPSSWPRVRASADATPPRVPVHQARISNMKTTDDEITFDVDQQSVDDRSPVLVKTSFFPNWQGSGADGPWRVAPNLMVVVPTRTHVVLHYGYTPVDNAGRLATLGGLVAAGLLLLEERRLVPTSEPGPIDDERVEGEEPVEDAEPTVHEPSGPWAPDPAPSG